MQLQNFDSFNGGTLKQYRQIAEIANSNLVEQPLNDEIDNMLIRGGVFWSDRKKSLIAGKLQNGANQQLDFKTFLQRLKETVN